MTADAVVLELVGIHEESAGISVLRDVQLKLYPGEMHALMGQNGAGKSTLSTVLTGALASSGGEMRLAGKRIRLRSLDAIHGAPWRRDRASTGRR